MDYKELYTEARERASKLRVQNPFDTLGQMIEHIFPELAESEDEKIRKDCIKYLDREYQHCPLNEDKMKIEKCIAWLEKQGEQKPETWCAEDEQNLNVVLSFISDECLRRWLKDKLCYDMKDAGYEWDAEKKELKKMPGEFTKLVHADFWDLIKTEHKMLDADKVIE